MHISQTYIIQHLIFLIVIEGAEIAHLSNNELKNIETNKVIEGAEIADLSNARLNQDGNYQVIEGAEIAHLSN